MQTDAQNKSGFTERLNKYSGGSGCHSLTCIKNKAHSAAVFFPGKEDVTKAAPREDALPRWRDSSDPDAPPLLRVRRQIYARALWVEDASHWRSVSFPSTPA